MLIGRTKAYFSLLSWLPIAGGIVLLILIATKADYQEIQTNLFAWVLAILLLVIFLFVLPIRNMGTWDEIHVDRERLTFIKQPSKAEVIYDLSLLSGWQRKEPSGRYDTGQHLYFSFLVNGITTKRVHVSESTFNGFDELVSHFRKFHSSKEVK